MCPLIVGDTAYPNKTWLIRPFKDTGGLTRDQRKFNWEVSKARMYPKNTFGVTKGRWRVLLKRLDEDTDRILDTSIVCCVLHNICVLWGDELDINDSNEDDDSDGDDDDSGAPPPLPGCSCGSTSPCSICCKSISSIPWFCPRCVLNYRLWNICILICNLFKQFYIWSDLFKPESNNRLNEKYI